MNAIGLFFITTAFFMAILVPVNRYDYPIRVLRSLIIAACAWFVINALINPSIFEVVTYLLGALVGTVIATFLNRRSAIMGGE